MNFQTTVLDYTRQWVVGLFTLFWGDLNQCLKIQTYLNLALVTRHAEWSSCYDICSRMQWLRVRIPAEQPVFFFRRTWKAPGIQSFIMHPWWVLNRKITVLLHTILVDCIVAFFCHTLLQIPLGHVYTASNCPSVNNFF